MKLFKPSSCYFFFLLFMLQLVATGCKKYPDCEDCQLSIKFGNEVFDYNRVSARENSSLEDRFSIYIGIVDQNDILRESLFLYNILEEEGIYPTVSVLDWEEVPAYFSRGGLHTYLLDGDVAGKSYHPDTNYTNYIEIYDWNPDEGYVEGQIVGTYIQDENHVFEADTLEISTNIFRIQLKEIE